MAIGALVCALSLPVAGQAMAQAPEPSLGLKIERFALAGEAWKLRGAVTGYVPGETLEVRVTRGGRLITSRRVLPSQRSGRFVLRLPARAPGSYRVVARHVATPGMAAVRSRRMPVHVRPARAHPGARGFVVRRLQHRLRSLGYVVGRAGHYDARTARAVLAFRKNAGLLRTTYASEEVFRRLREGRGRFPVRFKSHGRHIEADLSKQVMALIGGGGKVARVYPISSGAPATPTVLGNFRVYSRQPGTNSVGMIHSSYFTGAYAIHGYHSVPVFAASHGCLRVPPQEALSIFRWIRLGTRVDVYP